MEVWNGIWKKILVWNGIWNGRFLVWNGIWNGRKLPVWNMEKIVFHSILCPGSCADEIKLISAQPNDSMQ